MYVGTATWSVLVLFKAQLVEGFYFILDHNPFVVVSGVFEKIKAFLQKKQQKKYIKSLLLKQADCAFFSKRKTLKFSLYNSSKNLISHIRHYHQPSRCIVVVQINRGTRR